MYNLSDLEALASILERSDAYRVLRRLPVRKHADFPADIVTERGVFLDLETTGLDPRVHEIIEIALVPFDYTPDGHIVSIGEPYCSFQQPFMPISPEITKLTGITPAMVEGCMIDMSEVKRMIEPAALICAHNARFDRPFSEDLCRDFATKRWACSLTEVSWKDEGFGGAKLGYLLAELGYFTSFHRAYDDCMAAIEVLSRPLPKARCPAFAKLLARAETTTYRVWAQRAPYERKDDLKLRGYRWNGTPKADQPKSWYRDLPEDLVGPEFEYLRREIYEYDADIQVTPLTAYERYSDRG